MQRFAYAALHVQSVIQSSPSLHGCMQQHNRITLLL